jgi:thymidine kinase
MSDHLLELQMVCKDCGHVAWASFRYDSECGDLVALDSAGENCEECNGINLEQAE